MASPTDKLPFYSSCDVADALLTLGVPGAGFIPDIHLWSPEYKAGNTRVFGPAYTVKMVPVTDKESPKPDQHFVDAAPNGSVVCISQPADTVNAVWGGLMTARAQARGALGVVVDGRIRDLNEQREAGFPVFAKTTSIMGAGPFTRPTTLNQPITMQPNPNHPAVTIHPGDYIIADADGVVVVPKDMLDQVRAQCEKSTAVDDKCMQALKAGHGIAETFKLTPKSAFNRISSPSFVVMTKITSVRSLYHECQSQGQCGKHTLNNLLQGPVFSTADLDIIAENLRQIAQENLQTTIWKNPYKSPLGMGYYDVSVLEAALNQQNCTLSWFDARRDIAECLGQQDESMVGLIAHVPTSPRWIPFWKGQHWFGILRLSNGAYIDMDSRLSEPVAFAGFDDTITFLNDILHNGGRLFLIHRTDHPDESPAVEESEDSCVQEDPGMLDSKGAGSSVGNEETQQHA
ncbi:hypothetical protein BGX31_002942 [Mortierella sp. GBA43]|nr:hypothetical protein BGX31_002942 [Mortierella sp. GBA43]